MTVPVRWLLGRRALGLDLRAGHAGVSAPIGVVTTTELTTRHRGSPAANWC
ncbi:hypothetical protein [Mycolicibacterium insubricum]|uniref:hypothetical protein n=1 Tax=Mycolicibacterium insubricum TaxID=444597 RepID=UPI0021F39539|nr:hypothetical protein [Mycolicibacterium insubricum]MCV7081387.1 hypothetical protein [Mycolicibacterium insubricum]